MRFLPVLMPFLLAASAAVPALATSPGDAPDVLAWTSRILQHLESEGLGFHSLAIKMPDSTGAPPRSADIEIESPEKLYRFTSLLTLATGPSNSSRTADKVWHVRFPVDAAPRSVGQETLSALASAPRAFSALAAAIGSVPEVRTTQIQLKRTRAVAALTGVDELPFGFTLDAPSGRAVLRLAEALSASLPELALHEAQLAPVGPRTLGSFKGTLLVAPATPSSAPPESPEVEARIRSVLESGAAEIEVLRANTLPGSVRIHFECRVAGAPKAWALLERILGTEGLDSFEILELRQRSSDEAALSGLLYF